MTGLVPVAVGCTVLADPLVHLVLPADYAGAGTLLALGIWRAPSADPGLSLPDDADRAQSRDGRRAHAGGRRRWRSCRWSPCCG